MSSVPKCTQTGSLDNFNKFYNSLGQSPCYIASALANVCMGGEYTLLPLNASQPEYSGPSAANANSCMCSSVYYSLLSACSICQTLEYSSWSSYSRNCQAVYLSIFPQPIPAGISIPHYAYLDVKASGAFNPAVALSVGGRRALVDSPQDGSFVSLASGQGATAQIQEAPAIPTSENPVATATSNTGNPTTSTTSAITSSSSTSSRSTNSSSTSLSSTSSSSTSSRIGSSTGSATQPTLTPTHTSSGTKGGPNVIGPIVAGIGFLLLVLVWGVIWFWVIKPRRKRAWVRTRSVPKLERSLSQYSLLNPPPSTVSDSGVQMVEIP